MSKFKTLSSLLKIGLLMGVVVLSVSASSLPAMTGAFVNSLITAVSNPLEVGAFSPPASPLFWLEEDTTQVKIDWIASTSSGVTNYKIYRSTDNSTFTLLTTVGAVTTYTDSTVSTNADYYYKVTAVGTFGSESVVADVTSKYAGPRDIVIDDDAQAGDFNSNGTVAQGGTGTWDKYATLAGPGVNVAPDILQNAVGGDNYSTSNPATGQTFTWTTNDTLNGNYDVLVQYICDPSRGNAEYQIFSGATSVSPVITKAQNLLANGSACGPQGSGNTESHWLNLGTFPITAQGKVVLTAPAGQAYILADAVAFHKVSDITVPAPVISIDPKALQMQDGYACGIGSAVSNDELKVTVTNWQSNYKLQLRYKVAGGGYNSFADASTFGLSPTIVGGTATFEYMNTGNSPAGAAGWQAQLVDTTTNIVIPGSNTAELTYIISTDPNAAVCNGHDTMGFETKETLATPPAGETPIGTCPVLTADKTQNGNTAATQIIKWNDIQNATHYRVKPYRKNGASWVSAGSPVTLNSGDYSVNAGVVSYSTGVSSEGTFAYYVEALDGSNNVIAVTTPQSTGFTCTFTVDWTPPLTSVTVSSSSSRNINNRVINGDFESGLTGWTTIGDVALVTGSENGVTPFGNRMLKVGRSTDPSQDAGSPGNSVDTNILSQPINNSGNGVRSVGFWYNFQTYESSPGFDDPGMMVFINDKMVHQVWSSDVANPTPGSLHGTGWRFLSVDLSGYTNPTLSIAFYAGNTGDRNNQSFIYVDNVTTNEAAVNSHAVFTVNGSDNVGLSNVNYHYTVSGSPTTVSGPSGLTFSLNAQPDNGVIEYWGVDTAGNVEPHNNFHVMYDDVAPAAVTDMTSQDDTNGDFTLNWTAPSDANPYGVNQAAAYDLRYSTSPISPAISDSAWAALPQPIIRNSDGQPGGGMRDPLVAGGHEIYNVHVNDGAGQYYFAVKSSDQAKNVSAISNIATTGAPTPVTTTNHPGDVVINEIMWMGTSTNANDQWLELRNMTNKDIDLSNWVVMNGGNAITPDITLPSGLLLPANGYFVIAHNHAASSALKNEANYITTDLILDTTGKQLTLKDNAGTVIDLTPTGAVWAGGENTANKRSMERVNVPGDGSDAANWHTCDSQSCTDAQALYWDVAGTDFGTPGAANLSFTDDQITTTAKITKVDDQHMKFTVDGVNQFTSLSYVLEYDHLVDSATVHDAVTGDMSFAAATRSVDSQSLYLGTCSTGGDTCVPHIGVTNVKLTVILKGSNVPDRTVSATLN